MMAPIPEEVGKTSRDLIGVFQSSPMVFAMLLFNLLFMGMIIYIVSMGGERWERALKACQDQRVGAIIAPPEAF